MGKLPLEGVRVAEITVIYAGPYLGMMLADLGAEVISVESTQTRPRHHRGLFARPPKEFVKTQLPTFGGYPNRDPGERPWNRYPPSHATSRNKVGMTVDLRRPEGLEIFKKVIAVSDVFVENNRSSAMNKLGVTYEALREVKRDIIMLRLPAYGSTGPYSGFRAIGPDVEAVAGHHMLRGYADMDPTNLSLVVPSDASVAAHGVFAILAALHYRKRTGKGQQIEAALSEVFASSLACPLMDYSMNGRVQSAMGNRDGHGAIQGCYPCAGEDTWIAITILTEDEWACFCRAIGAPTWTSDPRFANPLARRENHDELDVLISEWTAQQDPQEALRLLQGEGVASGVVEPPPDAYRNPQHLARGFFEQSTQADTGTYLYPGMLFKMSKTPLSIRKPHLRLGEDNEYVYKDLLGYSEADYARLEREGHIGTQYAPGVV